MSVIIRLEKLPWNANSLDIRRFFGGLDIPDGGVHIVGGEHGTVFIAFATDEDARQALMKDNGRIRDEPIKLFLSSRTDMQNIITKTRGTSVPVHEVFTNPSYVKRARIEDPSLAPAKVLGNQPQRGPKNLMEEGNFGHAGAPRFPPAAMRSVQEKVSDRRQFESLQESRYLKPPGSGPADGARKSSNESVGIGGIKSREWGAETQKHFEVDFQKKNSDNFGGPPEKREREVMVRPSFTNRSEPAFSLGRRPVEPAFEGGRNDGVRRDDARDDSRFVVSKKELYGGRGRVMEDERIGRPNFVPGDHERRINEIPPKHMHGVGRNSAEMSGERNVGGSNFRQQGSWQNDWCVHVYNLPMDFKYKEIRRYFANCQIIQSGLKLIGDDRGRKSGECYIRFSNEESFQTALGYDNAFADGNHIRVEIASAADFEAASDMFSPGKNRMRSRSPLRRQPEEKSYCIMVKNIPYEFDEVDLIKWLGVPPPKPDSGPYFAYDELGNRLDSAFVKFDSAADVEVAQKCHGRSWRGRRIDVCPVGIKIFNEKASVARPWAGNGNRGRKPVEHPKLTGEPFATGNTRNVSAGKFEDRRFYIVRIRGLPFSANQQAIKEFFKGLEIANGGIHLVFDKDNQAATVGFVEFVTSTDCNRALDSSNTYMGKRYLIIEPVTKEDFLSEFRILQQKYGTVPSEHGNHDHDRSRGANQEFGNTEAAVRMRNLHFKVQLEDILLFFKGHRPILESIKMQYRDGRPTGDGMVSFPTLAEAEKAIKDLHHRKLLGWPLSLTLE